MKPQTVHILGLILGAANAVQAGVLLSCGLDPKLVAILTAIAQGTIAALHALGIQAAK